MRDHYFYTSDKFNCIDPVLRVLHEQSASESYIAHGPDYIHAEQTFSCAKLHPILNPNYLICKSIGVEGHVHPSKAFDVFTQIMPIGERLGFMCKSSGFALIIHFEEKGTLQSPEGCTCINVVTSKGPSTWNVNFARDHRTTEGKEHLLNFCLEVQRITNAFKGKNDTFLFEAVNERGNTILKWVKEVYELFSDGKVFEMYWSLNIFPQSEESMLAADFYNRLVDESLLADRFEIKIRGGLADWRGLEELRRLCGENQSLWHPFGRWEQGKQVVALGVSIEKSGYSFGFVANHEIDASKWEDATRLSHELEIDLKTFKKTTVNDA